MLTEPTEPLNWWLTEHESDALPTVASRPDSYVGVFLVFDFCRFCVVIQIFHPRHKGQIPPTSKNFRTRFYPLLVYPILILEKEPVFPFLMGTTGTICITSLLWRGPWLGIEPGTSALEATTLPLGYQGGGPTTVKIIDK